MRISDWSSDVCSSDLPGSFRRCWSRVPDSGTEPGAGTGARHIACWNIPAKRAVFRTKISKVSVGMHKGRKRHGPCRSRSEEQTSELQSLMRISYAAFFLTKKKKQQQNNKQAKQ